MLLLGAKRILVVMVGRLPSLALPASRRWILKQPERSSSTQPGPYVRLIVPRRSLSQGAVLTMST